MPSGVKAHEENARAKLVLAINALPNQMDEEISSGRWLVDYLK
jgi:origin recognition complex subunit 3